MSNYCPQCCAVIVVWPAYCLVGQYDLRQFTCPKGYWLGSRLWFWFALDYRIGLVLGTVTFWINDPLD